MTPTPQRYQGCLLRLDEKTYEVEDIQVEEGKVRLIDAEGLILKVSIDEFRTYISTGLVDDPQETAWQQHSLATRDEQEELQFRVRLLEESDRLKQLGLSWKARLPILKRKMSQDPRYQKRQKPFPSLRTVKGWQAIMRSKGISDLRPKTKLSGNRNARHDRIFEDIVLETAEEGYLASDRITVRQLARTAKTLYEEKCKHHRIPPRPCGEKVVRSIIGALPRNDVVKSRLGTVEARARNLQAVRLQRVEAPLERVELDCTTLDLWCVSEEGIPVGRPTVCAAIDCATGIILGLQVSWEAPNSSLVARTLYEVMLAKNDDFFDQHSIEHRYQAFGRPMAIFSDQGSENSGSIIESFVRNGGAEWRKVVPGQGDRKPFIERFFLELSRATTQLPGASQTSEIGPKERTALAQSEASYTLSEAETYLQRWRYDVYARTPRRRIQSAIGSSEAPIQAWKRLSKNQWISDPPTPTEVREMFMVQVVKRKAQRDGLQYKNIKYSSEALRDYISRMGPGIEVDLRINPHDIREIAVFDQGRMKHFYVRAKDENCPAISFAELDRIRKELDTSKTDELHAQAILAAMKLDIHHKPGKNRTALQRAKAHAKEMKRDADIVERPINVSNRGRKIHSQPRIRR